MSRLANRVALITGAVHGIGRAIAARFASEGARLVLVDIAALGDDASSFEADRVVFIQASVTEEATLQRAVALAVDTWGRLDILINNAYAASDRPIIDLSADEWRYTLDGTLTSVFYGVKHAIPVMQRQGGGAIVNMSSVNSPVATPGMPAYTAAKGAVDALTHQLAVEYGPYGIRTNAIRPGLIATDEIQRTVLSDPAEARAANESCPLRRPGTPDEIASVALFLASDDASYINGVALTVDGGTTAQWPPMLIRPGLRRKAQLPP